MKLEPGKSSYTVPVIGKLINVIVTDPDRSGMFMALQVMELSDLIKMRAAAHEAGRADRREMPRFMALTKTMDRIEFFPAPNKAFDCRISYYPPAMEH